MLNPNFRDMLSALNDAAVDYLVVGAYAMAADRNVRWASEAAETYFGAAEE